jgi:hypothetical protein
MGIKVTKFCSKKDPMGIKVTKVCSEKENPGSAFP